MRLGSANLANRKCPGRLIVQEFMVGSLSPVPQIWYSYGMRTTIDKAGRLVVPKALRDRIGLHSGEVEITADGASLRIEPVFEDSLVEKDGRLFIPTSNTTITDEFVRELMDADQK